MPANLHSPAGGVGAVSRLPHTPSEYVSPGMRRSIGLTSPVVASGGTSLPQDNVNDDTAEKRRRRRSRLLELHHKNLCSPGTPPDRRRSTPTWGLSGAQLTDHYADCIKLSTENKINSKNAFGLHLIDYMTDLLKKKEMTNFQVASSTLDASAKIYAGRVDAIHSETYKVLTGLGRGANTGAKDVDCEGDDQVVGDDGEHEIAKKKRRVVRSRNTQETNLNNINVKKFDLEFEVDPLFHKMSAAFDEGGSGGLLLNHLSCLDNTSELYLDSSTVVPGLDEPRESDEDAAARSMVDLREFRDAFSGINLDPLQICPTFAEFEFTNWSKDADSSFSLMSKLSGKGDHAFDLEAEPAALPLCAAGDARSAEDDFAGDDYDDDGGDHFDGASQCGADGERQTTFFGDGSQAKLVESAFENMKHGATGTLMQILASEPSDYSYFNTDLLRTWAGPQHWKLNPKSKDPAGDKVKKPRTKVEAFKLDYDEDVNMDSHFKETRAAVMLTDVKLEKKHSSLLPYDPEKQFHPEKMLVKPRVMVKRLKRSKAPEDIDGNVENYDYDNPTDRDNFCPAEMEGAGDEHDDDDDDHEGGFDFTVGSDSQGSFIGDNTLGGDNLVEQPRKVAKIDIGYAKQAKKVDVRKLKSTMWTLLTKAEKPKSEENRNEEEAKNGDEKEEGDPESAANETAGELTFTEMVNELPKKVPKHMARSLSVPIAFVCLLHLANEKTLKITSDDTMSNLNITQG